MKVRNLEAEVDEKANVNKKLEDELAIVTREKDD